MRIPGLNFVAIDFETANNFQASVCAVGLVRVRDGEIAEKASWLIRPFAHIGGGEFGYWQMRVHGITPEMVAGAPTFAELYPNVKGMLGGDVLVAHNASFDRSCLAKACAAGRVRPPGNQWACTMLASRRALPHLANHKLPTVAEALGVEQVHHHDAADDALVAANIHIRLAALRAESTI